MNRGYLTNFKIIFHNIPVVVVVAVVVVTVLVVVVLVVEVVVVAVVVDTVVDDDDEVSNIERVTTIGTATAAPIKPARSNTPNVDAKQLHPPHIVDPAPYDLFYQNKKNSTIKRETVYTSSLVSIFVTILSESSIIITKRIG